MTAPPAPVRLTRGQVSILLFATGFVILFLVAPDVILILFAGILFAIFLSSGGDWIARRTGVARGWGVAVVALALLLVLTLILLVALPFLLDQVDQLARAIADAVGSLRSRIERYAWLESMLGRLAPASFLSTGGTAARIAISSTVGTLGNLVILIFVGLYGAANPAVYRRGTLALFAPELRSRAGEVLDRCVARLRQWLVAQLMSMMIVAVLTWLGLWLVGLPLSFLFGVIAGLLTFIPNIGPILAAVPAVLIATTQSGATVLWVIGVYVVVQALESYLITPRIQQEKTSLPPALLIAAQVFSGVAFGVIGLALASPLTVLAMTLVNETYRRHYLEG